MKRPWNDKNKSNFENNCALLKLENKSPEMAELLIELMVECRKDHPDYLTIARIAGMGMDILKEVGYDPTMDEDPA